MAHPRPNHKWEKTNTPGIYRRDDGKKYKVVYRDADGEQRTKTFDRKTDAGDFLATTKASILQGSYIDPRLGRSRLETRAYEWLTGKQRKPKTLAQYESSLRVHVLPVFGKRRIATISTAQVQQWVAGMLSGEACGPECKKTKHGAHTVRKAVQVLHAVLEREVHVARSIVRNPAERIELPPLPRRRRKEILPSHIGHLAWAITPQYRLLMLIMGYLGLRRAECAGLHVDHVDFEGRRLFVADTISEVSSPYLRTRTDIPGKLGGNLYATDTKNHIASYIPLPQFIVDELRRHIELYVKADGMIFTGIEGGPLRSNIYSRDFKAALESCGLDATITFHDLRSAASSIARSSSFGRAGGKLVQELLMRHQSPSLTDDYTHVFGRDVDTVMRNLDETYGAAEREIAEGTVTSLLPAAPESASSGEPTEGDDPADQQELKWGRQGSNLRPTDYESAALTN
jgi:integrase